MIELPTSWQRGLADELGKPYVRELQAFIDSEEKQAKTVYPARENRFKALELTPLEDVRVVILGQDPYHGPNQAHGLSFSVPPGEAQPPSLRNIFKELESDLGIQRPDHGNLECWARQGVLLLNAVLTVEAGHAGSHAKKGWETFTDRIIKTVSDESPHHVAFVLWGAYAQKKAQLIDQSRHLVISSAHPSPLSASRGFFGSQPFSRINEFLVKHGERPIDWHVH